jgi:hypothetical protein
MDYSKIIEELQKASLFDLYRLQVAISRLLENPDAIQAIRNQLKPDQVITYFGATENREIEARVLKLKQTRVLVENLHDKQLWNISFSSINLARVDTALFPPSSQVGLDKNQLKVGDRVGFLDQQNNDLYGEVTRLNRKTATVVLDDGAVWRVSYKLLSLVIEGERIGTTKLFEGTIVSRK